nr:hypothetical protein [Chloroflexia bacterium]
AIAEWRWESRIAAGELFRPAGLRLARAALFQRIDQLGCGQWGWRVAEKVQQKHYVVFGKLYVAAWSCHRCGNLPGCVMQKRL